MRILLVGSGGREHAIAWKLAKSERVSKIFVAPGNGGTAIENKCENINITDIDELVVFARENNIDLTAELQKVTAEMDVLDKLKDTAYDFEAKEKILEKEYSPLDDSYEMKIQAHKRGIKWGKFFNKIL